MAILLRGIQDGYGGYGTFMQPSLSELSVCEETELAFQWYVS